jgi:multidrug efflux pump subunit AcrA (membrane-fusion protein)
MPGSNGGRGRWIGWLVPIIVVLIGGPIAVFLWFPFNENGNHSQTEFATYTVEALTETDAIQISGNIAPIEEEDIGFYTDGKVAAVHVREGDWVEAGTVVAELDNSAQFYDLASLDMETENVRIAGSAQELALLELKRKSKIEALEETRLYTTISGYVVSVNVREGESIKSRDSIDPIIRISNLSSMMAEVEIDEIDVPRVRLGQKVRFDFDALPNTEIFGRVSKLPMEARVTGSGIAVLDAEVIIDDPPEQLVPGYSFSAEILVGDEDKVLVLDEKALMEQDGQKLVLRAPTETGSSPALTLVKTASYGTGKVRILSGLSEGDTVLAARGISNDEASNDNNSTNPLKLLGLPGGGPPPGGPPSGRGNR